MIIFNFQSNFSNVKQLHKPVFNQNLHRQFKQFLPPRTTKIKWNLEAQFQLETTTTKLENTNKLDSKWIEPKQFIKHFLCSLTTIQTTSYSTTNQLLTLPASNKNCFTPKNFKSQIQDDDKSAITHIYVFSRISKRNQKNSTYSENVPNQRTKHKSSFLTRKLIALFFQQSCT